MTTNDGTVGRYLGWFLVALSLGAGVIHFAVAGGHYDVSWAHGTFLAAVAWLQLSWAAAVVVRPTRRLLALGALGNTFVVAVWIMSRTTGVPVNPNAWESEPVSLADGFATGLEVVIVVTALAVLVRPALAQLHIRPRLGLAAIGTSGLAIAVVSTLALTPSLASDHHGDGGDGHGHGAKAEETAAAHAHPDAAADPAADTADTADTATAHDAAGGHVEGSTNYMIMADGTSACEEAGIANEGNSGHGHRGPVPWVPMDEATRDLFGAQVAEAEAAVARYPTVADAEAAGYNGITPYVPCIAAHYIKSELLADGFDPAAPEILLYEGNDPDSGIVGLSYLQFAEPEVMPEGFAGGIDLWHIHRQLCIGGGGGIRGDENTTEEECAARGGRIVPLNNLWMNHMWPVPGWPSRWGLFSSEHPDLGGDFGDLQTD